MSIVLLLSLNVPIPSFKEKKKHGNLFNSVVHVGLGWSHGRSVVLLQKTTSISYILKNIMARFSSLSDKGSNLIRDMSQSL